MLAVGINLERGFCFYAQIFPLRVLHLGEFQVSAKINRGKKTEQSHLASLSDNAHIEPAVIEAGAGSDFHAPAIGWAVGEGGEKGQPRSGFDFFRLGGDLQAKRPEAEKRGRQAERVTPVPQQPARQPIGPPRDFAAQADARHRTEIMVDLGRANVERPNHSQINPFDYAFSRGKSAPGGDGVFHSTQAQGTGKIIAAAARNNQHRQVQPDQLRQMTVNGAVAAENENHIRLGRLGGKLRKPADVWALKWPQTSLRSARPKDGSDPHCAGKVNMRA